MTACNCKRCDELFRLSDYDYDIDDMNDDLRFHIENCKGKKLKP